MTILRQAKFLTGARKPRGFPPDSGNEVVFSGRSNAGKSSALNILTGQKSLARVSKSPGRTREINFFAVTDEARLVDLPGYGYAKVAEAVKQDWYQTIDYYLRNRESLCGMVQLMDCRHPLNQSDVELLNWCARVGLPVHVVLTKADKLSRGKLAQVLQSVAKSLHDLDSTFTLQALSVLKKNGIEELEQKVLTWLELD